MLSPITAIATDLAAQNPGATSEQITEILVSSIESGPMISDVIARIQVPSKSQMRLAELRSNRLPKNKRARVLERIENAKFLRKLQLIYMMPIQDSDLRESIHRDGARVELSSHIAYSSSSYERVVGTRHLDIDITYERIQPTKDTPIEYLHSIIAEEASAQNAKEDRESSSSLLEEIGERFEGSPCFLSLYHIHQIIRVMETSHDQDTVFDTILNVIASDIKKRNRTYRLNCIEELYRGDDSLPDELRVRRPSSSNVSDRIYESLKAIIVNEYRRLHNQCGQQFLDNQLTYDMYIQTTNRYSVYADRLFSELSS